MLIPTVIKRFDNSERAYDVFSLLLKHRIVFLNGQINDDMASIICAQLLFLESEDDSKDINLYINSPGGSITSGLAIYDAMNYIKCDVKTIAMGSAASCGSLLLVSGAKGKRCALPNTRIMIHEPFLSGMQGRSVHIEDHANETVYLRDRLKEIYLKNSKTTKKNIDDWFLRDKFFSAVDAKHYGFIDEVIENR